MQFFRASFLHLIKDTESMQGHATQIFKVKTLLNNAFNMLDLSRDDKKLISAPPI